MLSQIKISFFVFVVLIFLQKEMVAMGDEEEENNSLKTTTPYSILLVEETGNKVGVYDSNSGRPQGQLALSAWPHEITVSKDGKAYVSNFGLRDYDMKQGYAGNSISIIDTTRWCEIDRLYTTYNGEQYWAPHGVKLSPDEQFLFVNVECVESRSPTLSGSTPQQQPKMLIFNLGERKAVTSFRINYPVFLSSDNPKKSLSGVPAATYSVLPGTHNFVISKKGDQLWYYSGVTGITCVDPHSGQEMAHLTDFQGAVRGLSFNEDGTLLVSATNEINIVDPIAIPPRITKKIGHLGVGQLFYSTLTPDRKYVLAPAAWDGQVVVIDFIKEKPHKRIVTGGVDPLQTKIAPGEQSAFITYATSHWIVEIDLENFEELRRIHTKSGSNGIAFGLPFSKPASKKLQLGVCLPFTGEYGGEGRECRLGLQYWQDTVNSSGGLVVGNQKYRIEFIHADTSNTNVWSPDQQGTSLKKIVKKFLEANPEIKIMLGTYPSELNHIIARIANSKKIPFITATGREPSLFQEGLTFVFGISPVREGDLKGTLNAIWKKVSPKPRTAIILACDRKDSLDESKVTAEYARSLQIELLKPQPPKPELWHIEEPGIIVHEHRFAKNGNIIELDNIIAQIINGISPSRPDLFLVAGHNQESLSIIRSCSKSDFTPGVLAFNAGAAIPNFHNQLGNLANNLVRSLCWSDTCFGFAEDRFVAASDFQRNFTGIFSERASELTAGFAACGVVIEEVLRKSQSLDGETMRKALSEFELSTFYGPIIFNPSSKGRNIGKEIITVQFKPGDPTVKEVPVWPPSLAGKEGITWPFSGWPLSKL